MTHVGGVVEKRTTPSLLVGVQTGTAAEENSHWSLKTVWWSLKKFRIVTIDPAIPPLGIYPKKSTPCLRKDTYIPTFIAESLKAAEAWRQPKCPAIEDWGKKVWCTCPSE